MCDDMISTGGSFRARPGQKPRKNLCRRARRLCARPENRQADGRSDRHGYDPHERRRNKRYITVLSVAKLLGEAIRRIHENRSLSQMIEEFGDI
jgi:hypothetical protein